MADSVANPVSIDDVANRSLRSLTDVELGWAAQKLDDAFDQLLILRPTVGTRLAAGDVLLGRLVTQVVSAMILRVLGNPDGHLEETVDDYTYRLDQAVSSGQLYPTDAELELVSAGSAESGTAFTIRQPASLSGTYAYDPYGFWRYW